jgi:hypothetical protein
MLLQAGIDVETLFGTDTSTLIYKNYIQNNNSLPSAGIMAKVNGFAAYVETDEKNLDVILPTPIILNKVKEALSSIGCTIVDNASSAGLIVKVIANSRVNINQPYVSSVFAEAKVSVLDVNSGKQLLSKVYSNVRGFGDTMDAAGANAYNTMVTDIVGDIKRNILK